MKDQPPLWNLIVYSLSFPGYITGQTDNLVQNTSLELPIILPFSPVVDFLQAAHHVFQMVHYVPLTAPLNPALHNHYYYHPPYTGSTGIYTHMHSGSSTSLVNHHTGHQPVLLGFTHCGIIDHDECHAPSRRIHELASGGLTGTYSTSVG
jgi:hypothetical protein